MTDFPVKYECPKFTQESTGKVTGPETESHGENRETRLRPLGWETSYTQTPPGAAPAEAMRVFRGQKNFQKTQDAKQ